MNRYACIVGKWLQSPQKRYSIIDRKRKSFVENIAQLFEVVSELFVIISFETRVPNVSLSRMRSAMHEGRDLMRLSDFAQFVVLNFKCVPHCCDVR